MTPVVGPQEAERQLRAWLESFVVGMNLCPFARPLLGTPSLRIAICEHSDDEALAQSFLAELDRLHSSSEHDIATTLLAFTSALADFDDYLDFLDYAQQLLEASGLEGVVQLASFHPAYCFADAAPAAASNFTNKSPLPVLHLLREDMLTRALREHPDPGAIPRRNIELLSGLGTEALQRRWQDLKSPAARAATSPKPESDPGV